MAEAHARDAIRQISAMKQSMPDFAGLLNKPILPKATGDFPVVREIEKPRPAIMTKADSKSLLYKMQSTKVAKIIRAFRAFKLHRHLKRTIAVKKVSTTPFQLNRFLAHRFRDFSGEASGKEQPS